jgi:flagellar basal-body rod modification protein FlgD
MVSPDLSRLKLEIDAYNKSISPDRKSGGNLDKDDFLKILITQLKYQDPSDPMKDKEFIAQMAQFSSLEQITNMTSEFKKMAGMLAGAQAVGLIGKTVQIVQGENVIQGRVEAVRGMDFPTVLINGKYYDYSDIESVRE